MIPRMNLEMVRVVAGVGIVLTLLALASIVLLLVLRGGLPENTAAIASLVGIMATLAALLAGLLGVGTIVQTTAEIKQQFNGHLDAHARAQPPLPPPPLEGGQGLGGGGGGG